MCPKLCQVLREKVMRQTWRGAYILVVETFTLLELRKYSTLKEKQTFYKSKGQGLWLGLEVQGRLS